MYAVFHCLRKDFVMSLPTVNKSEKLKKTLTLLILCVLVPAVRSYRRARVRLPQLRMDKSLRRRAFDISVFYAL